ncbi:MAG TPA: MBL fold metallo-hydrolase, partial [Saprospiraceae bacterium]|nr:MBL fold metallo-hydrolase [Saprospiraceae bacterium]
PVMTKFVGCPYDSWIRINNDIKFIFKDAGHILGSANVTLSIMENGEEKLLGCTGDIGRPNRPIIKDPVQMPEVDYLITESTYGDRLHESDPQQEKELLEIIEHTCINKRGKLIIPAFSVERTQEIIYMLDKMQTAGIYPEKIPVYVDSPLAVNATMIFASHPECYDKEIHEYLLLDDNPFGFKSLHYNKSVEGSKRLNTLQKPMIIISAAGMMNAGRVKHHLYNNVEDPRTTFLLVGYCSPQTPWAALKMGGEEMKIFGDIKEVNAEVISMDSFSGHGDRDEMLTFLENQKNAKKTFIVHGEYESQKAFKKSLENIGFKDVYIPMMKEEVKI